MTMLKLAEIAEVTSPLTLRGNFEESTNGDVRLLAIRDLIAMNPFEVNFLPLVQAPKPSSRTNIGPNDILMPARGNNYPARLVPSVTETILPTGQIHVIRSRLVNPKYLVWFLNRKGVQEVIRSQLTGSTIQSLKKSDLERLEIEIPPLEYQEMIGELMLLKIQRDNTRKELQEVESQEMEELCEMIVKKESN